MASLKKSKERNNKMKKFEIKKHFQFAKLQKDKMLVDLIVDSYTSCQFNTALSKVTTD